ncbi:uncharacterized protein LOC110155238 [Boleophthalmus pectinirostris]|uniref:uncharacterized protein LOC110155238 n=1 Tax=Boleophthalmus pectinirostris TaxID=150288 RepID=UPI000A1C5A45|nr:uncharacterized protein LOC110155238 [Boleophthalmus pectinirostris]
MATRALCCLALLLICLAVVNSWRPPRQEDGRRIPGACSVCKRIVKWVQSQLSKDSSKEKIENLLNRVCLRIKSRLLQKACKLVLRKLKKKLINTITNKVCPLRLCRQLRLCKKTYVMWQ